MNTTHPALMTAVIVMCFGALMVQAGIAKRQLAWRPRRAKHQGRRRRR